MPSEPQRPFLSAHLVIGLLIIVVGVLFTLDNLDMADAGEYLRYWPAGLLALGVAKVIEARGRGRSPLTGVLFAAVGTGLLLETLDLVRVSLAEVWPVVLVAIGCVIVWQGLRGWSGRPPLASSDDVVSGVAVLSGVTRRSNSPAFRGGELTAFLGGCEIDLRQAAIDGEAVIDVFAMWGGIEIRVPEDWTVIGRVTALLGGVDDRTRAPARATAHRLVVRGLVVMGGVEIKH